MGSSENFDGLRRLLGLKRHEQPPPRYFDEFSSRVLARIEAGEVRLSWWERFGIDLRPALAAAMGVLACGLVVYGVATAGGDEQQMTAAGSVLGAPGLSAALLSGADSVRANSTNPVSSYGTPIDRNAFRSEIVPASYLR